MMGVFRKLVDWLKLPEMKDFPDLDVPSRTALHSEIIQKKAFLKALYTDFYKEFLSASKEIDRPKLMVELGSGGGFIKEIIPGVVTSDILRLAGVDRCFSALNMPFENGSVDAFFMIDVLHHINDSRAFFKEANRCLKAGGRIVMVEPANTLWSRLVWSRFHHEDFDVKGGWGFKEEGALTAANSAIPWIIFFRDRKIFEKEYPGLKIIKLRPHIPFRYLLSGGLSCRQLLPSFTYKWAANLELLLSPFNKFIGMFYTIELAKG